MLFSERVGPAIDPNHLVTVVEDRDEQVADDMAADKLSDLYREGTVLRIGIGICALADRVHEAIKTEIPESTRGDFCPGELWVSMGYHDIFECAEHEEGKLFGRAFVSVNFFGYSTPLDWKEFRRRVFKIREIQAIRKEIERVVGPLQQCIYWDI